MSHVTITLISSAAGRERFRIEGTPTDPEWAAANAKRHEPAWCEVGLWREQVPSTTSYGGSVWPGAWPELFTFQPGTVHYGASYVPTDLFWQLAR